MTRRIAALAVLALALTGAASAQVRDRTFEISPFAGYLFGGEFERGSVAFVDFDVEADDAASYGIRLGYNLNSTFQLEVQLSRSETEFVTKGSDELFGDDFRESLADLDIDYALGYLTFNFGRSRLVPYITLGAGVARLDPGPLRPEVCPLASPLPCPDPSSETRFTASLGGGVKTFFTPNFGLRLDGRGYATALDTSDDDDFCDDFFDNCDGDQNEWLTNGEVSVGLVFAF